MKLKSEITRNLISLFLRVALGTAFLSAVADRFGMWGNFGRPNVAWGDWGHFVEYAGKLNWFVPVAVASALAWIATILETVLGITLILGLFTRISAILSGILLMIFAITMAIGLGIQAPFNYSVFTAAAGAFMLASVDCQGWSLDSMIRKRA